MKNSDRIFSPFLGIGEINFGDQIVEIYKKLDLSPTEIGLKRDGDFQWFDSPDNVQSLYFDSCLSLSFIRIDIGRMPLIFDSLDIGSFAATEELKSRGYISKHIFDSFGDFTMRFIDLGIDFCKGFETEECSIFIYGRKAFGESDWPPT